MSIHFFIFLKKYRILVLFKRKILHNNVT